MYVRMYVCVYVCVLVGVCMGKSVHEMEIFVDSDMDGCLHDELWYFVPDVHSFRSRDRISLTKWLDERNIWEEFFTFILILEEWCDK